MVKRLQNNTATDDKYQRENPTGGERLNEIAGGTLQHDMSYPEAVDTQIIIGETRERVRRTFKAGTFFQQRVLTNYYEKTSTQSSN